MLVTEPIANIDLLVNSRPVFRLPLGVSAQSLTTQSLTTLDLLEPAYGEQTRLLDDLFSDLGRRGYSRL